MAKDNQSYYQEKTRENSALIRKTVSELPARCADFIRAIEPSSTALTRLAYARDLRLFFRFLLSECPEFADKSLSNWSDADYDRITARHYDLFLEYLTLYVNEDESEYTNADLSKLRKLSTLRSFNKYLFKRGVVSANVSELVETPKRHDKPILRLEIDEVARLLDAVETGEALTERQKKYHAITQKRDLAMLTLFLGTGIRVSECVGLDINDVDFTVNGFLVTRKGGNQAILYFPDEVADVMKEYVAHRKTLAPLPGHEDALFLSMQNRRITVRAVENLVKKYALHVAPLKKKMSPHKLRATFATNLYHETEDIYLVADVLGHSDVNTTRRHYAAMSDSRRRQAAKAVVLRGDEPSEKPES